MVFEILGLSYLNMLGGIFNSNEGIERVIYYNFSEFNSYVF